MTAIVATPPSPILVGDPDADDLTLLGLLLRKAGINDPTHAHATGAEMIAALTQLLKASAVILPLVCFLELTLPDMPAVELVQWIRRQPALDNTSVVVWSACEDPAEVKKAARAGAQCYLAKYPQPRVLRAVIHEARRFANGSGPAAGEWFGLPANLLLRWGLSRELGRAPA